MRKLFERKFVAEATAHAVSRVVTKMSEAEFDSLIRTAVATHLSLSRYIGLLALRAGKWDCIELVATDQLTF